MSIETQVAELGARLESMEIDSKNIHTQKRMELKVKELESKVELEQTAKSRLEVRNVLLMTSCFLPVANEFLLAARWLVDESLCCDSGAVFESACL